MITSSTGSEGPLVPRRTRWAAWDPLGLGVAIPRRRPAPLRHPRPCCYARWSHWNDDWTAARPAQATGLLVGVFNENGTNNLTSKVSKVQSSQVQDGQFSHSFSGRHTGLRLNVEHMNTSPSKPSWRSIKIEDFSLVLHIQR